MNANRAATGDATGDATRIETDLVVIGGGGSGLAAAAEAARLGLRVLVLEKADRLGGTTALSVGSIMAAQSIAQLRAGIADTPETHAKDLDDIRLRYGIDNDAGLTRLLTENVADTIEFLRSIGVNFLGPLPQPPHTAPRLHQAMPTSRAYIVRLERHCRKLGVTFRLSTRAVKLRTEDGEVVGVDAEGPGPGPGGSGGGKLEVSARAGVLLASGDIGGDQAMMHAHMKTWVDGIEVFNPVNTGDGQRIAAEIGARIVSRTDLSPEIAAHMRFVSPPRSFLHAIPPYPFLTRLMVWAMNRMPERLIRPVMMRFLTSTLGPDSGVYQQGAILVNKLGERFADERDSPNLHVAQQPDGEATIVFDDRFARKFSRWPYFIATAPGVAFAYVGDFRATRPDLFTMGDSIDDLAAKKGFLPGRLADAIAGVNADRDEDLKLTEPPFYALGPVKLWLLIAPIGLAVNERLDVLDEAGKPIPGLYAAGGAGQGGFTITGHGHGLGWAFTTGRLAARTAASRLKQ